MRKATSKRITAKQAAELKALSALPDRKINTAAVPEQKHKSVFVGPATQVNKVS